MYKMAVKKFVKNPLASLLESFRTCPPMYSFLTVFYSLMVGGFESITGCTSLLSGVCLNRARVLVEILPLHGGKRKTLGSASGVHTAQRL